jgi:hypothetical protein
MLQSGLVKLASNDDVWWELTALTHHYWTQPLATWTSYYVHDLPLWFQKLSVVATYIIEIALPFLIVFPRRIRMLAFWGFTLLMLMIAITGNYTYFNLLTFVLCLMLIDDQSWPQKWRHAATGKDREDGSSRNPTRAMAALALPAVMTPLILVLLAVNIAHISWHYVHRTTYSFIRIANLRMQKTIEIPRPKMTEHLQRRFQPFNTSRSVNSFGLFANMTETRPEIIIEGSQDLRDWKPYEFKWKPGRLDRRPGFVQPHQPRLDWQMWFAALGNYRGNPWLISLMNHMLRGTPEPLSLLAHNPFPDAPPRFVRATTYDYTFTSPTEKRETGNWWKRDNPRPYTPALTLQGDQLVAVSPNN